jgi:hypothetical protein
MKDTPFRLILFFLSQSAAGMTVQEKQEEGKQPSSPPVV